ncbi:hypothetical protein [Nostoc sp. 'Lobaria pulmonaria (5183) cyanobiont']|uniref:hypothetical protein n=1 Tax=Nostoc sp. 'Lobaria pulmonaria (5183) cyanobiont' TaxID=1618022 RepID=UPI000CF31DD8|nr:hypothetical protein [Nostoc sp. 'Lobaria pulmonaria (5183) cyanobiont']
MTQEQTDLLLALCKPYLLDLLALLAKSAKYDDDPISDLVEGESYKFPAAVLEVINEISYAEKVSAMNEITYWLSSSAERQE